MHLPPNSNGAQQAQIIERNLIITWEAHLISNNFNKGL
jgi:hypothetical protein